MELTPAWTRPLIAGHALSVYLQKLVWPNWFAIDEGYPPKRVMQTGWVYVAWIVPAAITAGILLYRAGRRPLMAGWIVVLAGVAPVLGLVPFVFQYISTVADRYMYLSMLGVALAGSWLLSRMKPRVAMTVACVLLVALGIRSYLQASTWADSRTVFEHTVRVNPDSFLAQNTLAAILGDEANAMRATGTEAALVKADGLYAQAEEHVDQALRIWPDYYMALKNRAALQLGRGDVDGALRTMQRSVEAYERFPESLKTGYVDHLAIARAAIKYGRPAIAEENARLHLEQHPDSSEARQILKQARSAATQPAESR
jgi:Tfp pilus assembly protein FimV